MKNVAFILGFFICFYSCKKEDNSSGVANSSYLPMTVGNLWVYREYDIDTSGMVTQTTNFDSTFISKDTMINGVRYFRFDNYHNFPGLIPSQTIVINYYKDSSKNLVDSKGQILFSETNFSDTLFRKTSISQKDTFYWLTGKMGKIVDNVSVPCGVFSNVLNVKYTVICNPKYTAIKNPRYNDNYYAKDIGRILYSDFWLASGIRREFRLEKYKIVK